jgi:uncharacterized protein (TIGR03437 family)
VAPVQVRLGGVGCDVLYAGLAPDFVGVYQINIRVPALAPSGSVDLVVTTNGAGSHPAKTWVR